MVTKSSVIYNNIFCYHQVIQAMETLDIQYQFHVFQTQQQQKQKKLKGNNTEISVVLIYFSY